MGVKMLMAGLTTILCLILGFLLFYAVMFYFIYRKNKISLEIYKDSVKIRRLRRPRPNVDTHRASHEPLSGNLLKHVSATKSEIRYLTKQNLCSNIYSKPYSIHKKE